MSKLIYMKELLNTFSQEQIQSLITEGELKQTETDEPYIVIKEQEEAFTETEDTISI